MNVRSLATAILFAGCSSTASTDPGSDDAGPLTLAAVSPTLGSVGGGTLLTLTGTGMTTATAVTVGDVDCANVAIVSATQISCITGNRGFHEGTVDISVKRGEVQATLPEAFTYQCLWTTTTGRPSCGAAPPEQVAPQPIAAWVTQFQAQHGFVATSGTYNLAETTDFVLGKQSVWMQTDGIGGTGALQRIGMAPIDFRDQVFKIWVKVENVAHLSALDVWLGDSSFANTFRFRLRSSQGQQWMTEGDWVAFTVPWAPSSYSVAGAPNRAAITDIMIRAADDATGRPVRVHLNGLALVPEPITSFPNGVVSFTFDDNWDSQYNRAFPILTAHRFAATEYVIVDTVGVRDRATLADLRVLQEAGWDIAAHANTDLHHFARYPSLATSVVEDDMVDTRAWLIAQGFNGYDHCAYPGGDFTGGSDVLGVASRYFTSCRTVYEKQQESYPPSDPRKLRVLLVTGPMSLATVQQQVDYARYDREWLILVFHQLVPRPPASTTEWSIDDFTRLVDHVAASGVDVEPVSAVLAR